MNLLTQTQAILQTQMPATPAPQGAMTPDPAQNPALAPVGEQAIDNISGLAGQVTRTIRSLFPDISRAERILLVDSILTFGVIILTSVLFALCGRIQAQFMQRVLRGSVIGAGAIGILAIWVPQVLDWFETPDGARIGGSALTILSVVVINALLWEGANRLLLRTYLNQTGASGQRLRTLMPLIRRAVMVTLVIISTLTILTELGLNIAPLLAGAGVIGIAVGFGSQKLVQDFITGLFIILEDAISLGDVVTIEAHSGVVEDMTLRTVRLRDVDGAVHILPFSEVRIILNRSKGFGYAVIDVDVAYGTDVLKVESAVHGVMNDIRAMPDWANLLADDVEIMGIERFGASSITFRFRQRCPAGKQWALKREILRRIHIAFAEQGIEIPFPTVMQVTREPHQPSPLAAPLDPEN